MDKKNLLTILFVLLPFWVNAQTVIQMEKENGVFKIACKVNGARMKMVFDTGAASVSLSMSMANYLYENDYITKDDIIGAGQSKTADGSIVDHIIVNLKDIEISGLHIKNVKATVIDGQNVPLLLGQTAIQKLGPVTISGSRLIINNSSNKVLSEEEVVKLKNKADSLYNNVLYNAAFEIYSILRNNNKLSLKDYCSFIFCCIRIGQYERAVDLVSECENTNEFSESEERLKQALYSCAILAYAYVKDYEGELFYTEKEIASKQINGDIFGAIDYVSYASTYEYAKKYNMAILYRKRAIAKYLSYDGFTIKDIFNGSISDEYVKEGIGESVVAILTIYFDSNKYLSKEKENYMWAVAAKCGNKFSIDWCKNHYINYKSIQYNSEYDDLFIAY